MRTFRPLESKTPCETCEGYCSFRDFDGKPSCNFVKGTDCWVDLKGETLRACKDYKEIKVKNSLFKKLLKFIGVGK